MKFCVNQGPKTGGMRNTKKVKAILKKIDCEAG